jgi:isopenicillin N synthase-like dioxygenase
MNLFKVQGIKDRDAASPVPVIDFAEYFAGAPGALPTLAVEVRDACKNVGFSYALGHGVDQAIIDRAFAASRRFHALPLEQKLKVKHAAHRQQLYDRAGAHRRAGIGGAPVFGRMVPAADHSRDISDQSRQYHAALVK